MSASNKKGKTYEDMYGEEYADIIKSKISMYQQKKQVSKETKRKMSISKMGTHLSKETKSILSKLNSGINNPNYGKKRSKETKLQMSKSMKGKNVGNIPWNLGFKMKYIDPNYVNAFYGKKHTNESKQKMREARLKQIFPYKDTNIEVVIQKTLKKQKITFKKHVALPGQPDIFIAPNICIFCDGDYWHANPNKYTKDIIISRNRNLSVEDIWKKDKKITNELKKNGYLVLRFWEYDILNNITNVLKIINTTLRDNQ